MEAIFSAEHYIASNTLLVVNFFQPHFICYRDTALVSSCSDLTFRCHGTLEVIKKGASCIWMSQVSRKQGCWYESLFSTVCIISNHKSHTLTLAHAARVTRALTSILSVVLRTPHSHSHTPCTSHIGTVMLMIKQLLCEADMVAAKVKKAIVFLFITLCKLRPDPSSCSVCQHFPSQVAGGFPIQWQSLQQIVETHEKGPKPAPMCVCWQESQLTSHHVPVNVAERCISVLVKW